MQMKMSQVMLLNSLRGQIEGNQYSIKTSYKIAKLFDDIEEEVNFYTKKLKELIKLITEIHGKDKILIFTQYADTAKYLYEQFVDIEEAFSLCLYTYITSLI